VPLRHRGAVTVPVMPASEPRVRRIGPGVEAWVPRDRPGRPNDASRPEHPPLAVVEIVERHPFAAWGAAIGVLVEMIKHCDAAHGGRRACALCLV
jgi:hypothetical protein